MSSLVVVYYFATETMDHCTNILVRPAIQMRTNHTRNLHVMYTLLHDDLMYTLVHDDLMYTLVHDDLMYTPISGDVTVARATSLQLRASGFKLLAIPTT